MANRRRVIEVAVSSMPVLPTRQTWFARPDGVPVLRGWLHGAMTPLALAGVWVLLRSVGHGPVSRASVAVFGVFLVGLYAMSALYHLPRWGARAREILCRCDGAMIQLFIAATFTPIGFHTLDGRWRLWSLVGAWAVGITGATIAASPLRAPRWLATLGYIAFGWLSVVPFAKVISALPWQGSGLIMLGGVLYTLGAVIYAARRPDPFPTWFGYHEVFHLFVVAGSTAHYLAIWRYVL